MKKCAWSVGIDPRLLYQRLFAVCLRNAIREQGLEGLVEKCREIIPDISDQYTASVPPDDFRRYYELKLRGLHAFQVNLMLESLSHLSRENICVADVGDSSGNHALYLKNLAPNNKIARVISVNLDPAAVEKVRAKGGEAVLCRAEELRFDGAHVDLFMSFEMVEHLTDPLGFFHRLAAVNEAPYLLMTVPYRKQSRFGGYLLRRAAEGWSACGKMTAEEVHLFELSPDDWILMAGFGGWKPVFSRTYYQYPRYSPWRMTAPLWRLIDFEGFFGVFLKRDLSLADLYEGWPRNE